MPWVAASRHVRAGHPHRHGYKCEREDRCFLTPVGSGKPVRARVGANSISAILVQARSKRKLYCQIPRRPALQTSHTHSTHTRRGKPHRQPTKRNARNHGRMRKGRSTRGKGGKGRRRGITELGPNRKREKGRQTERRQRDKNYLQSRKAPTRENTNNRARHRPGRHPHASTNRSVLLRTGEGSCRDEGCRRASSRAFVGVIVSWSAASQTPVVAAEPCG